MKRIAKVQIDYRTKEQEDNFLNGDRTLGYSSVMPGEVVPEILVPRIVAGNPGNLEPLTEVIEDPKTKIKKVVKKKGHGLDEKQLFGLRKLEQLELLLRYGITGDSLEKMKKGLEPARVKKLLEFR